MGLAYDEILMTQEKIIKSCLVICLLNYIGITGDRRQEIYIRKHAHEKYTPLNSTFK